MDELTQNAEEPDDEKPEVQKLGKLQYKVVRSIFAFHHDSALPSKEYSVKLYHNVLYFSWSTILIRTAYQWR